MNKFIKRILGAATAVAVAVGSLGAVPEGVLPSLSVVASALYLTGGTEEEPSILTDCAEDTSFSDGVYELKSNVTVSGTLYVYGEVKINLNGYTLTANKIYYLSGSLVVDGQGTGNNGTIKIVGTNTGSGGFNGNVSISNATIDVSADSTYSLYCDPLSLTNVTFTDSCNTIQAQNFTSISIINCTNVRGISLGGSNADSVLNVTNSEINGNLYCAFTKNNINISGSEITGNITCSNETNAENVLTISGNSSVTGKITGRNHCVITDSTLSGCTISNAAITNSTIQNNSTVTGSTVTGGTIISSTVQNSTVDGNEVTNATYDENGNTGFTVTFNLNGATGSIAPQSVASGEKATVPDPAPTRTGYTFKGWYTTSACTGTAFDFANTAITANTTLYAKWLQHITYIDAAGASATCTDYTVLTGSENGTDTLAPGWYVVNDTLNYTHRLIFNTGDVNLILCDNKSLNIGTSDSPVQHIGLYVQGSLTVYGQGTGNGALNIYTSSENCSIFTFGDFTQNGGNIKLVSTSKEGLYTDNTGSVNINNGSLDITTAGSTGIYCRNDVNINGGVININAEDTYSIECALGCVYLSWTKPSDSITLNKRINNMSRNKPFVIEGTNTLADITNFWGNTIVPACSFKIGGDAPTGVALNSDGTVTPPTTTISGLTFDGWYKDSNCTQKCAEDYFDSPITTTTAFYGRYVVEYVGADGNAVKLGDDAGEKFTLVTSSDTGVTWEAGTYVVADNVEIKGNDDNSPIKANGNINLILCDGKKLTITMTNNGDAGINAINYDLTIYGQSVGSGELSIVSARPSHYGRGIKANNLNFYGGKLSCECTSVGTQNSDYLVPVDANSIKFGWTSPNNSIYIKHIPTGDYTYSLSNVPTFVKPYIVQNTNTLVTGSDVNDITKLINGKTLVPAYKVTFNAGDGQFADESSTSVKGVAATGTAKVTAPTPAPILEGCILTGWYTDEDCTEGNKFSFSTAITADTTLYAKWAEITLTKVPAKAATCTAAGNKEYYKGSDNKYYTFADDVYTETTLAAVTIAKLGHNYVNGKCTRCGEADPDYKEPDNGGNGGGNGGNGGNSGGTGGYTPVIPSYPSGGNNNNNNTNTTTNNDEPKIEGGNGASGWSNIASEISKTPEGGSVTIDMNGTTTLPKDIITALSGRDIDLVLDMGEGIKWTINGKDVTAVSGSIDMGVTVGESGIPIDVINNITGEKYSIVMSLAHNGSFGFTATLTVGLRKEDAGLIANLFHYSTKENQLEYVCNGKIREDGTVDLTFTHASDYTIIVDDHDLGKELTATVSRTGNVKLSWTAQDGAESYSVYQVQDGKWVKLGTTSKTAYTVKSLANNKTYKFMVRAKIDGKLVAKADAMTLKVKVYCKPAPKATTADGRITLTWKEIPYATKYRIYIVENGKLVKLKDTNKLKYSTSATVGKTYKFAVKAYVNGKWTSVKASDIIKIKAK